MNEKDKMIISIENVIDILQELVDESKNDKDYLYTKLDYLIHKDNSKIDSMLNVIDIISFEDLCFLIDNNHVSKMLLGTKVYIDNPKSLSNIWIIVDINSEGTKNTVELRSYTAALITHFGNNNEYFKSNVFDKLNELAASFPKDVRKRMHQFTIFSESSNFKINQNIKLPSMTELGLNRNFSSGCTLTEGTEYRYPLYLLKYRDKENNYSSEEYVSYLTRTRYRDTRADSRFGKSCQSIWIVKCDGSITTASCYTKLAVAPIIRIGKLNERD